MESVNKEGQGMMVAVICISVLGFMVFGLGFYVSVMRARAKVTSGTSGDPASPLDIAVRAHGNTVEYAPFLAILMLYLGSVDAGGWVAWVMILAVLSRIILVAGFLVSDNLNKSNSLRFIGALGTYLTGAILCIAALMTIL